MRHRARYYGAGVDKATKERLVSGAAKLGVTLDGAQVDKLAEYLTLLQTWNRKINLTAITEPSAVVERHFLDSLAVVPLVRDRATPDRRRRWRRISRARCWRSPCPRSRSRASMRSPRRSPFCRRSSEPSRRISSRSIGATRRSTETFDAAVSRATWDPPEWVEHGARLVHAGGIVIAMQTADAPVLEAPAGFARLPPIVYAVGDASRRLQAFRRA